MITVEKKFDDSFDIDASNYDDARPDYPEEMYADIIKGCELNKKSTVLEVGTGSGIATVRLAESGAKIVGIEPGINLAKIAKGKTKKYSNVKIFETTFENFKTADKFDCLIAPTSFHWISKKTKYKKAYDLLNRNGAFVIVWNSFFQSQDAAAKEVNKLYREILSEVYPVKNENVNFGVLKKLQGREIDIIGNEMFYLQFCRKYINSFNYDKDTYPRLLRTFPKIIKIENKKRADFLLKVSRAIEKYGKIKIPVLTTLMMLKKKKDFLEEIGEA